MEAKLASINQAINGLLNTEELYICGEIVNYTSLRAAARSFNMDPSLLSRKLKTIEGKLDIIAITKSPTGIIFSKEFIKISKQSAAILEKLDVLRKKAFSSDNNFDQILTFAGPGYLNTLFSGDLIKTLSEQELKTKCRFIDVSPIEMHELAKNGLVDIIFSTSELDLEKRFCKIPISTFEWAFFLRTDHPMTKQEATDVKNFNVVSPVFFDGHKFNSVKLNLDDKDNKITWGHESQTAASALSIAEKSDHLAYLPILSAYQSLKAGEVKYMANKELGISPAENQILSVYVEKDKVKKSTMDYCIEIIKTVTEGVKNEIYNN